MPMSQKQIDEFLKDKQNTDLPQGAAGDGGSPAPLPKNVKPYNFLSPQRYQKDQVKMLDNVFENFARFIGSQLTSLLRVSCTARIVGTEEMKFRDYNNKIGDSSLIGIIELFSPENGIEGKQELMVLEKHITFAIMDYMLGGDGSCYNIDREYTEIEMSLLSSLLHQLAPKHNSVWSNYAEMERSVEMIETNLRMIQTIGSDETIVVLDLELSIRDLHGSLHLCIPSTTMDAFLNIFHTKRAKLAKPDDEKEDMRRKNAIMGSLKGSCLTVTGILGTTEIHVQELLDLQPGDIFLLNDAGKEKSVNIRVEGEPWFRGKIGVHKKNYAVKLTEELKHN